MADLERFSALFEKYGGASAFLAGQAALNSRRAEFRFNNPARTETRPIPVALPVAPQQQQREPAPQPTQNNTLPETVKIWPLVGISAWQNNHGGAWRLWSLARSLDRSGSGRCSKSELWSLLAHLGIGERRRRRWLSEALELGLMREARGRYYLAGLARAAVALGCAHVGNPVTISAHDLAGSGWRAVVWAGYLATLRERPISQITKCVLTGVDPRTQRNYQAAVPGSARGNYAPLNAKPAHVPGMRETTGRCIFTGHNGQVFLKLPDQRFVPGFVAKTTNRGRSRKAQRQVNHLSSVGQVAYCKPVRLFCEGVKAVKSTLRNITKQDLPPWERPAEVFSLARAGRRSNIWEAIPV